MSLIIRDARPGDLAAIGAIHSAARRQAYVDLMPAGKLAAMTPEVLEREWAAIRERDGDAHGHRMQVAERDGRVVGFVYTGPPGEVSGLHVHPSEHGSGIGRRLLAAGVETLAAQGFDTHHLFVLEGNERAIRFYERNGWRPDGERFVEDGDEYLHYVHTTPWDQATPGVMALPSGRLLRGRQIKRPARPDPHFGLYLLGSQPDPVAWEARWVRWPDFRLPKDPAEARAAFVEAWERAAYQRVEVACAGGQGRTGTALACLAILDGVPADEAVAYVRQHFSPRAVETLWQRRFVRRFT